MRVVIVGGGMVGMTFAHLLRRRGVEPVVLERMPAGHYIPRGYMLGFQGYESLEEIGVYDEVRDAGRPIAPRPDQPPVAVAVRFGALIEALQRNLPIVNDTTVSRPAARRRRAAWWASRPTAPRAAVTYEADLVVACDGMNSPTRRMAGLEADFDLLPEASLGFISPSVARQLASRWPTCPTAGHIGILSWHEGSAGWRSIDRVGAEAALAPGLDAIKEMWVRLLPASESAVEGLTSLDQVRYSELSLLRCPRWWVPGAASSATRLTSSGPRPASARASAWATPTRSRRRSCSTPNSPDAACATYEAWRGPVVRPYEAADPGRHRILMAGQTQGLPHERWPPPDWGRPRGARAASRAEPGRGETRAAGFEPATSGSGGQRSIH